MKASLSLNGPWRLDGIDAYVPGEVHVDLLRAGRIPDPYYGTNADQVQWVEEREWIYEREFDVDPDFLDRRTFLEFDGLDTFATVYLNGEEVGRADNMFVPHRFDVTHVVRTGTNTVRVEFAPAAKTVAGMDQTGLFGCFDTPRVNARKMQCAFGWDWTHRFVGAGIWRDARLVSYGEVSIADVRIVSEIEGGQANAWVTLDLENHTDEDVQALASIVVALGEESEKVEMAEWIGPEGGTIEAVIRIEQPQLWWPNGFGEQTLYKCMIGIESEGEVQDVAERRFGVCEVRFAEQDREDNRAFTLLVNGEEVFCKGANWIPADHFVSNVTADRYHDLVRLAKDANFNMLRVWGGGIYESPAFYEACDEMGIMVWQDFMFSCAVYPQNEQFLKNVAREVRSAVKELRNHPSIVVWCGNNECEMNTAPGADWSGRKIFHELIPSILRELDTSRPYRPSSPFGGTTGNDPSAGDWHGGSWFNVSQGDHRRWRAIIEEERGLFVSEFPTQGPPMIESLREFIPEDKLFPPEGDLWEHHNKDNPHSGRTDGLSHQQILVDLTRRMMGDFENAEQFAAYAGILQGEFIKAEFEHYRREKWAISGALTWMLNDCRPAVGWSLIDYYLRPKVAYYYAKRACAPVVLSFKECEGRVRLYVTSDQRTSGVEGSVRVGVHTFGARELEVREIPLSLPPNSSRAVWESAPLSEIMPDPSRQCIVALLNVRGQTVAKEVYFPLIFRDMDFPQPKLLIERQQLEEDQFAISFSATEYARSIAIGNLPALARPSDNYFDLLPGEICNVMIESITPEEAEKLTINVWRV